MKRTSIILAFTTMALFFGQSVLASNNIESMADELRKEKNVTTVHFGKLSMTIASFFTDTQGLNYLDIVIADDLDEQKIAKYLDYAKNLNLSDYQTNIKSNSDAEYSKVLINSEKGFIREMLVLTIDKNNVTIVQMEGKISINNADDIVSDIVTKHTDGSKGI